MLVTLQASAQLSPHVVSFLLAREPSPSTEPTLHILYCFYIFSHGVIPPTDLRRPGYGASCVCVQGLTNWALGPGCRGPPTPQPQF